MKKITELTETKYRTTHYKDAYGNRTRGREEYIAKRPVRTIKSGPRFGHFFIDIICIQIFITITQYLLGMLIVLVGIDNPFGLTVALISSLIGLLLFPFMYFFTEYFWQQTPGKLLTNSIVIDEYGNKPNFRQIALRSLIRIVPFEAFSCLGDFSYGWHDRWSDTFVVKKDELEILRKLQEEQKNN